MAEPCDWTADALARLLGGNVLESNLTAAQLIATYFGDFTERRSGVLERSVRPGSKRRRPVRAGWTGKFFDEIALRNQDDPVRPGALDLIPVACLSIKVDGDMTSSLLHAAPQVEEILLGLAGEGLNRRSDLWEAPVAWFDEGGSLCRARDRIKVLHGFGDTVAHKLMSAMFPDLLPVKDSVLVTRMAPHRAQNWWAAWKSVATPGLRGYLRTIRDESRQIDSRVPENLSLLRVADIAVWLAVEIERERRAAG